jgi:hypothetical protein
MVIEEMIISMEKRVMILSMVELVMTRAKVELVTILILSTALAMSL